MRVDEAIARGVNGLRDDFQKLYGIQEKLLRQMAEAAREGGTATSAQGGAAPESKEEKGLNPFLAAAVVAAVAMVTAVKDYFQNVTKLLRTLFKPITSRISRFFGMIGRFFGRLWRATKIGDYAADIGKSIRSVMGRLGNALRTLIPDPEAAQDAFKALKGYFNRIKTFFTTGGDDFMKFLTENSIFKALKTGFTGIKNFLFGSFDGDDVKLIKQFGSSIVQKVSDFFKPITNFFSADGPLAGVVKFVRNAFSFASEGSGFMRTLTGVGRVIGKLAWPITVIMSVIDGITGAFKGFVNTDGSVPEKLLMGLLGGISGIFEGLIGMPLDLLKSAVSWIAGKFGFEQVEAALDSFNFVDLIRDIYMSPIVMMKRAFNGLIELIATAVEAVDIPFVDEKSVADKLRSFKFEDTGESRTEMVARKKREDQEAGEALDAYDAEQGLGKKKYTSKKLAQAAAGPGETVVQDDTGAYRIKKKAPQEIQSGQLKGKGAAFVGDDALAPVPTTGPSGAPIIVNDNSSQVNGGGTTLAGETRPSTANGQAAKTGFYRSSGGF